MEAEKQRLRRELARLRHRLDRHLDRVLGPSLAAISAPGQAVEQEGFDWQAHVRRHPEWSLLAAFAVGWAAALPAGQSLLVNVLGGLVAPLVRPWLAKLLAAAPPVAEAPAGGPEQGA
jgi:hypothetical protein